MSRSKILSLNFCGKTKENRDKLHFRLSILLYYIILHFILYNLHLEDAFGELKMHARFHSPSLKV